MDDDLKQQLTDIASDLSEVALDQVLVDGLFRDIPVIGTAVQWARLGKTITDRIFMAKLKRFLVSAPPVSNEQRLRFSQQIANDEKERKKTGEALVLILDRLDSLDKVEILASLYVSMLKNQLTSAQFRRLASAVDLAFVDDLEWLAQYSGGDTHNDREHKETLVRTGLSEVSRTGMTTSGVSYLGLRITPLGELFRTTMNETQRR